MVVTTTPGFAGLWLIPRLTSFTAAHPDVDVRISAGLKLVNLERDGVDLAVRYCATSNAGPQAVKLFGEVMTPVCSPALRKQAGKPLKRPEDLQHHTLLHTETHNDAHVPEWSLWLRAMQIERLKSAGSLHFSDYDQMIQAAIRGQGVALGRIPLVSHLIKERKLVAPFGHKMASPHGYHLLRSIASERKPEVNDFAEWLLAEALSAQSASKVER